MVSIHLDIIKFLLIYRYLQNTYWFKGGNGRVEDGKRPSAVVGGGGRWWAVVFDVERWSATVCDSLRLWADGERWCAKVSDGPRTGDYAFLREAYANLRRIRI